MTKNKKRWLLFFAVMLFIAIGVATASAAPTGKIVQAYQGVKIIFNGQQLTGTTQPYIINNTTYVPLRMLMNGFGKNISWDAANYQVIITDTASSTETNLKAQLAQKDTQIADLQSTITRLNAQISDLKDENNDDSTSLSDIKETLSDYFEDAGDDYFDDDGIDTTISLSGDEDDLAYTIKLDFDDADDYDKLKDLNESDIKSFLNAVKSKINSEIEDTDYEDADLTGKLVDYDTSSYYVKYNGSSYTYSWDDEDDDSSLSDIKETLNDDFEDAGDEYFDDDGIDTTISLSGDEDELTYTIKMDFSDANDYDHLYDLSQSEIRTFLNAVKSTINDEIEDTDYEDADITGKLSDNDNSSYYVKYDGSSYSFSWSN